jgi:DNA-binding beta-propeller fold protein YncE
VVKAAHHADNRGTLSGGATVKNLSRLLSCAALLLCAAAPPAGAPAYHVAKTINLGGEGRWDYLTFDAAGHRLFIARETRVMVVNPDSGALLGEVPGLDGAHGVALATDTGHGFATSGHDGMVTMFDLKSLAVLDRIAAAPDADAVLYDPGSKRVFTFNGDSGSSTVIDAASGKKVGSIDLGGAPEFAVSAGGGKLFVNLEDKGAIAEVDAAAMKVTRQWSLAPCESPTGLAIDREHHLLFSGCRNKLMAISDAAAGTLTTTVPIGEGVDGCAFDAGAQRAFASNGDGTLTVVHEDTPAKFTVEANVVTKKGARTMTLDEKTHRVYTVTSDLGPPPPPTPDKPHPRPGIVPGTFTLLVLEP